MHILILNTRESKMRITGGKLRKRTIRVHEEKGVRPTASRVREAFFNIVGQDLEGLQFLDAFGGSGVMGIEAYSRGAVVTICENRKSAFLGIKKTIHHEKLDIQVHYGSVATILDRGWDIIFMDPPYRVVPQPWLEQAAVHVQQVLVFEHSSRTVMPEHVQNIRKCKSKRYGDSMLSFYEPE